MLINRLMKRENIIIVIILALSFVLRLYGVLVEVLPLFREATYGMAAWRIVEGDLPYCDFFHAQPPLSPFLLASIFLIFGVGVVQARLFLAVFTTFTTFVIFLIGKKIDYKTGLLGSLIFAVSPISIEYGMRILNDFIAMTFCISGYYFLTSVIMDYEERVFAAERNNLLLAGLLVGVGVLIKTIVAPIFFAFIVILIVEGVLAKVRIVDQLKNVVFLIIGFIIPLLIILSPFYLIVGDEFIHQVLGQHLAKDSVPLAERWRLPLKFMILENSYFFIFFALSVPFVVKKPNGRGVIICILFMVLTTLFLVPRQYNNYYDVNILWMSIACGFFPLPTSKLLNSKLAIVNFIIIANLACYKIYRHFNLYIARAAYFDHYTARVALITTLIGLTALIIILIKEWQFAEDKANKQVINPNPLLYYLYKRLRSIFNRDGIKIIIIVSLLFLIATTFVSYVPISEKDKSTIDWVKANTSSDEYVLTDDLKINFWAKRRSPFAEISKDRTDFGELTGELFIEACYEFDIKVVVNTGRMFNYRDTYNVFLEFLEDNYVPIKEGHTIYVRTTPLQ